MAKLPGNRDRFGPIPLRAESGKLFAPLEIASRIENARLTAQGTLMTVHGPAPYLPDYGGAPFDYSNPHGIFHALLANGTRDVLLVHLDKTIYVFNGWDMGWHKLIGPVGSGADLEFTLTNNATTAEYPTQFECTGAGIVIVPQGGQRAFYYDGEVVTVLGYTRAPSAPIGTGQDKNAEANDQGYWGINQAAGQPVSLDFGHGRLGYAQVDVTGAKQGALLRSSYQWAVQWFDYFGNISPPSGRSNTVVIEREIAMATGAGHSLEERLKQVLVTGIENGREGTIGKLVSRTKDLDNSGTAKLFVESFDSLVATSGAYATIPDNSTGKYSDNIPDSFLITEMLPVISIPLFKICRVAFGCLWVGGITGDTGAIRKSMPGRFGTFLQDDVYYPDPRGGEPTAIWTNAIGLLVFTKTSIFLMITNQQGDAYRPQTLDPSKGCVAPESLQNLPDGSTVWLGQEGFYRMDSHGDIQLISDPVRDDIETMHKGRACQAVARVDVDTAEYRCWISVKSSTENNLCLIFNIMTGGWARRTGEKPRALCVTQDHRHYMMMAGYATLSGSSLNNAGVYVLDHEVQSYIPVQPTFTIETAWIHSDTSIVHRSGKMVYFWLRETSNQFMFTVTVYRDYRQGQAAYVNDGSNSADTSKPYCYLTQDAPAMWGTTNYDSASTPNTWVKRRAFWRKISIFVPDCEVYKLKISCQGKFEFVGFAFDDTPHPSSGRLT